MKKIILLALTLLGSNLYAGGGTIGSDQVVYLTLTPGFCGEVDPYIVGDACVFKAEVKNTKKVITVYDNSSIENSDLAMTSDKHNLTEGNNCFLAVIFATAELTNQFGQEAYFSKILKRISCK